MWEELVNAGALYTNARDELIQELTLDAQHLLSTDEDESEMLRATLEAIAETQRQLMQMRKSTDNAVTAVKELQRSLHVKFAIQVRDAAGKAARDTAAAQQRESSGPTGSSVAASRGKENGQEADASLQSTVSLSSWKQEPGGGPLLTSSQLPPRRPPLRDFQLSTATLSAIAAVAPVPRAAPSDAQRRVLASPMSVGRGHTSLERTSSLSARSDGAEAEPSDQAADAVEAARDYTHLGPLYVTEASYASLPKIVRSKISLQDLHACLANIQSHIEASEQEASTPGPWLSEDDWRQLFPDMPVKDLTTMLLLLKKIKGEVLDGCQGYRVLQ